MPKRCNGFFYFLRLKNSMLNYVIIVAGGTGTRMNAGMPKQFISLAGKPILMHTIEKFFAADRAMKIIVVLPENEISEWKKLCAQHHFIIAHEIVKGGETRFHSVKNGLERVGEDGVVGVHDGVRPLLSVSLINNCFSEAAKKGNAVPCMPLRESVRRVSGSENQAMNRNELVAIQTPQCFSVATFKKAYLMDYKSSFTDDASVVEALGEKINLTVGEEENIKITFPVDLAVSEALIKAQQ